MIFYKENWDIFQWRVLLSSATAKGKNIRLRIIALTPQAFSRPGIWKCYVNELPFKCIFRKKKKKKKKRKATTHHWRKTELTFHLQCILSRYGSQRKASNDKEWLQHLYIFEVSPNYYMLKGLLALKSQYASQTAWDGVRNSCPSAAPAEGRASPSWYNDFLNCEDV